MARFIDARIPVVFGAVAGARDHVVRPDASWSVVHPAGCACCLARGPAALALDRIFLDRVRGALPWFERLVVEGDGEAVRLAVADDPVVGSRYRLEGE